MRVLVSVRDASEDGDLLMTIIEQTVHQLLQAFPWVSAPRYLLRDRDGIFGSEFVQQVKSSVQVHPVIGW